MYRANNEKITIATIGGTFDAMHTGHKEYIQLVFEYADHVLIYVNSDSYVKPKKRYSVRAFESRVKGVKEFISAMGIEDNRYEIRTLKSPRQLRNDYLNEKIDIAIVTPEYYWMLHSINLQLVRTGKKPVLILVKERTRDNEGGDLSSTKIHER